MKSVWVNCSRMRSLDGIPFAAERILDMNNNIEEEIELRELRDVLGKVMDLFFNEILTADEMTVIKMSIGLNPENIAYIPEEIAARLGCVVEHIAMLIETALGKFKVYLPDALRHYQSFVKMESQFNLNILH